MSHCADRMMHDRLAEFFAGVGVLLAHILVYFRMSHWKNSRCVERTKIFGFYSISKNGVSLITVTDSNTNYYKISS